MIETLALTDKLWNKKYENLFDREILEGEKKYSEHGEELVIQSVFSQIAPQNKWCVDIGACDILGSNTYRLVEDGWQAVLVEGEVGFFERLKAKIAQEKLDWQSNVRLVNKVVDRGFFRTGNSLEDILRDYGVPENFDFLSIDVDSYDFELWRNLHEWKPNLICIETNQYQMDFEVIDYDPSYSLYHYDSTRRAGEGGVTVGLLNKLAEEKGYDYLCWDVSNAFYIRKEFMNGKS